MPKTNLTMLKTHRYRVIKPTIYHAGKVFCVLEVGEECTYFPNSGVYSFKSRKCSTGNVTPVLYYEVIETLTEFFEKVEK